MRTLATIAALLFASAAFAQTPAHTASEAAAPIAAAGDWSAAKMKGVNVYNEANDKVGDVYDIIIDSRGRVRVLSSRLAAFWGMGTHYVLVAMNSLKFANKAGKNDRRNDVRDCARMVSRSRRYQRHERPTQVDARVQVLSNLCRKACGDSRQLGREVLGWFFASASQGALRQAVEKLSWVSDARGQVFRFNVLCAKASMKPAMRCSPNEPPLINIRVHCRATEERARCAGMASRDGSTDPLSLGKAAGRRFYPYRRPAGTRTDTTSRIEPEGAKSPVGADAKLKRDQSTVRIYDAGGSYDRTTS